MFFSKLIAATALYASVAFATIEIGVQNRNDGSQRNVAWLKGNDACAAALLSVAPANPCGITFSTGGFSGLELNGCGGSSLWLTQNGNFNHNCVSDTSFSKICKSGTIHKHYNC
ncbi:hypothetical protein BDD12DRAFT_872361 [Trichophaea hybrida]|nr:hypothetical protein BDD12DRAFT_872361 [Trichophaea hybrida]